MPNPIDKVKLVVVALEKLNVPHIDYMVDLIIDAAVESGRLECTGHDGLHFILGKNDRFSCSFDDAEGRFRSILARFYRRCKMAYPYRFEGGVYGFEADVKLDYADNLHARIRIKTSNLQAFPKLLIESDQ